MAVVWCLRTNVECGQDAKNSAADREYENEEKRTAAFIEKGQRRQKEADKNAE